LGRRRDRKAGAGRLGLQRACSTEAGAGFWRRRPAELGFAAAEAAGPAQKVAAILILPYLFVFPTYYYCPEKHKKKWKKKLVNGM
jgi:hypothetical protein